MGHSIEYFANQPFGDGKNEYERGDIIPTELVNSWINKDSLIASGYIAFKVDENAPEQTTKKYVCPYCDKSFDTAHGLKLHLSRCKEK